MYNKNSQKITPYIIKFALAHFVKSFHGHHLLRETPIPSGLTLGSDMENRYSCCTVFQCVRMVDV